MKIYRSFDTGTDNDPLALSFGYFDGVHLGHREIIREDDKSLKNGVVTFDKHPLEIIDSSLEPKRLMTLDEKINYLDSIGTDCLFVIHFDRDFMNLTDTEFMDLVTENLNMKKMKVGFNYHFGRKGMGNCETLREIARKKGFDLKIVDEFILDGVTVSSTAIRDFISSGEIAKANRFLGHPYSFEGTVREGKKLGRRIGIPTVNLEIDSRKVLPKKGVYVSRIITGGRVLYGISNVGNNPTFNEHIKVETHIFDFDEDLYGRFIRVELLEFEREERVFETIDELISTINNSISFGKEYVRKNL